MGTAMVDAISAPGMAVDIRLSTLEPVQQLGARLSHILAGELSKMRADLAFAKTVGITVQSTLAQADSLHSQQVNVLGHVSIGLTTNTSNDAQASHRLPIKNLQDDNEPDSEENESSAASDDDIDTEDLTTITFSTLEKAALSHCLALSRLDGV